MSLTALVRENRRIDAFSVIPHTQSELLIVVADFNLDLLGLGVPEGIAQRLGGNFVDLVTEDGMQISRFAFNRYTKCQGGGCLSQLRVLLRGC